jgi:hypothetical protein
MNLCDVVHDGVPVDQKSRKKRGRSKGDLPGKPRKITRRKTDEVNVKKSFLFIMNG